MKIYLAGMESILNSYDFDLKRDDNIFGTFFYKGNSTRMLEKLRERGGHKGLVTIDSGAHSFFAMAGVACTNTKTKSKAPDPDEYVNDYLSWVKENFDQISYFVELDIQSLIGLKRVKAWREQMKKMGIYSKCITVYHSCDEWEDYIEMLDTSESGYVGFQGLRKKKALIPYFKSLKEAYSRGIRVHGFALTDPKIMKKYPFYSVDSTTWTSSVRYGTYMHIDRDYAFRQKVGTKENYFKDCVPVEITKKMQDKEASCKKLEHSAQKFRDYAEVVTELWEKRGVNWDDAINRRR